MESYGDLVAAEDVLLFVNAAITGTGQREFHGGAAEQQLSLEFLHEYMLVNYRGPYAAALALDINDHNAALIVRRLLESSRDATAEQRHTEGRLIAHAAGAAPAAAGLPADRRAAPCQGQQPSDPCDRARLARRPSRPDPRRRQVPRRTQARAAPHPPAARRRGDRRLPVRPATPQRVPGTAAGRLAPRPPPAIRPLRAAVHRRGGLRPAPRHPPGRVPGAHRTPADRPGAAAPPGVRARRRRHRRHRRRRGARPDAAHPARLVRAGPAARRPGRPPRGADRRPARRGAQGGARGRPPRRVAGAGSRPSSTTVGPRTARA